MSSATPRRISVRGTSGSGKSTLGRALAARFDVPHTDLDEIYHQPNWVEIDVAEFRRRVGVLVAEEGWIIDGNYSKVADLILARAETVVWLDYPLPTVLWRVIRRTLRRGIFGEVLWNGNRESVWRNFFTRDSLILWVLSTHGRRRKDADDFMHNPDFAHLERLRFRHPRETDAWLRSFS